MFSIITEWVLLSTAEAPMFLFPSTSQSSHHISTSITFKKVQQSSNQPIHQGKTRQDKEGPLKPLNETGRDETRER